MNKRDGVKYFNISDALKQCPFYDDNNPFYFIPVCKWNMTYFAETTCCHKQFILDKAIGDMLRNGEDIEIAEGDLSEIY